MTRKYVRWRRKPWARPEWEERCAYLDQSWSAKIRHPKERLHLPGALWSNGCSDMLLGSEDCFCVDTRDRDVPLEVLFDRNVLTGRLVEANVETVTGLILTSMGGVTG